MDASLSLLLMLLKTSLLVLGTSFSHALDPRCPASIAISGTEEWANITTWDDGWNYLKAYLFVHPDPGFQGVSLEAAGNGWRHVAWFTLYDTCFPQEEEWWWLWARVERSVTTNDFLLLKVSAGECSFQCEIKGHFPGDLRLNVVAHGPSRLRFTDPDPCTAVPTTPGKYITQSCKNPPARKLKVSSLWFWRSQETTTTTTVSPALDQRCPADTTISGAEEWANTATVQERGVLHNKYLFVQPRPDFKGVSLIATGDGWRHDAWFTLNNTCFPKDAEWWRLSPYVEREGTNNYALLVFGVSAGECSLDCLKRGRFPGDISVNLKAQGPSRWRSENPWPCGVEDDTIQWSSSISCIKPLVPKTNPTTENSEAVIVTSVIIVVIIVVGGAAVVVVAKSRIRQRRPPVPQRRELASSWTFGRKAAEPPRAAVVVPREPPRQEEPGYLYMGGKKDEEPIYEDMYAPAPCQKYENFGCNEDGYVSPRRDTPGTRSGVIKDEDNIYEVIDTLAPCHRH